MVSSIAPPPPPHTVNYQKPSFVQNNGRFFKYSPQQSDSVLSAIYLSRLSLKKALRRCRYSFCNKSRILLHFSLLSRAVFLSSLQRGLYLPEYLYILSQARRELYFLIFSSKFFVFWRDNSKALFIWYRVPETTLPPSYPGRANAHVIGFPQG